MYSKADRSTLWSGLHLPLFGRTNARRLDRAVRPLESRLWAETETKMNAASLCDKRVLLVGFPPEQRAAIRDMLSAIGVRMVAVMGTVQTLGSIAELDSAFALVIVNFDGFADTEDGVDALLAFRSTSRRSAVVLCSSSVKDDDLSNERAAICDATLRLPGTPARVRGALLAALENRMACSSAYRR